MDVYNEWQAAYECLLHLKVKYIDQGNNEQKIFYIILGCFNKLYVVSSSEKTVEFGVSQAELQHEDVFIYRLLFQTRRSTSQLSGTQHQVIHFFPEETRSPISTSGYHEVKQETGDGTCAVHSGCMVCYRWCKHRWVHFENNYDSICGHLKYYFSICFT